MYRFIGHEEWRLPVDITDPSFLKYIKSSKKVTVLRNIYFFYAGEITTLGRITAHYTDFAIDKLVNDKFIEIHD